MDQFDYEPEYPEEPINYPNNEPIVLIDYYQKLIKYFDNYLSYLPEDINPLELDKYDRDNYHIYNMDIGELKTLIEVEKQKLKNYTFIKPQPPPPQNKELPNQISYSKELINYYEKLIRRCDIILSNDTLSEFDHLYAYCRDDYKDKLESAIHRYIRNYRMYVEDQDNKLYNIYEMYEEISNSDYNSDEYRRWNIKFLARQSALFQYQEYRDSGPLPIEIEQEEWKDAVISRNPDPDYNLLISFESNEGWSPDKKKKYFIYLKSEESDIKPFHSSKTLIIEYLSGNWYIISGEITNFPIGRSTNIVAYPVEYYILKMNEAFKNLLKKFKSDKDNKIEDYGLEPYLKDFQESILNNPIELDRALESLKEKSSKNYLNKYKKYPNENRNYKSLYLKYKKKYLNLKYSNNKDHKTHNKNYPSNS